MARTNKDGEVFLTAFPTEDEQQVGTIEKTDDGLWLSKCAGEDGSFTGETKAEAVTRVEEHFIDSHTTLRSS